MDRQTPDKTEQAKYYDEWFHEFDYGNFLQLERAASILACLRRAEIDRPRILDFGCGPGWLTNILSVFGPTVGVDLSPQAISEARQRYPNVKFEASDVFEWAHPDGTFDVVISQEVLEHVIDQDKYLEMAATLLRDGGCLILTTPNAETMMAMPEQARKAWTNQPIENWRTVSELRRLMVKQFDDVIDYDHYLRRRK